MAFFDWIAGAFASLWALVLSVLGLTPPTTMPTLPPTLAPTTLAPTPPPTLRPTRAPATNGPLPNVFTCPESVGTTTSFTLNQASEITIQVPEGDFVLCTLTLQDSDGFLLPVARSYNGNDWERVGGALAAEQLQDWDCSSSNLCSSTLPRGDLYRLETKATRASESPNTNPTQQWVRFLEAATFGATPTLLSESSEMSLGEFIQDQLSLSNKPPSFHRKFFRQHTRPIWRFHKPEFAAGLQPCVNDTYWVRHWITVKDIGKEVEIVQQQQENNGTYWQVSMDNHIRAVLPQLRFQPISDGAAPEQLTPGTYQVCSSKDEMHRGYFRLKLIVVDGEDDSSSSCRPMITSDMQIDFASTSRPELVLLDTTTGDAAPSLMDDTSWQQVPGTANDVYRQLGFLNDTNPCDGLFPENDGEWDYQGPPLFLQTVDKVWLQFTPRIEMRENTVEQPLADGGARHWSENKTMGCSNVPRSFLNEHGCILSKEEACKADSSDTNDGIEAVNSTTGVLVCGSPNEVANDPNLGDNRLDVSSIINPPMSETLGLDLDTSLREFPRQREFVWSQLALTAPDQLRQRMAWALIQIFSIRKSDIRNEGAMTEGMLNYFDIFVRHGLGNYLDILKGVSYSPIMAENLSFINSRSTASLYNPARDAIIFPDENYARELMQLFSLGLVLLNQDGTPKLDPVSGRPIRTYDSVDVRSMSRCWTGFVMHKKRANVEMPGGVNFNVIDPIQIVAKYRDRFPKKDLFGDYIGDGFPLCKDLPPKTFLRENAKYRLLGSSATPDNILEHESWASLPSLTRLELMPGESGLYEDLCAEDTLTTNCTYPAVVVLEENLVCPASSTALECIADRVDVVGVDGVYYEHIRQPCVEMTFYENAKAVSQRTSRSSPTCANPELPVAGVACCDTPAGTSAEPVCDFVGERVKLQTATDRCASLGKTVCAYESLSSSESCPHSEYSYSWRTDGCTIKAKINGEGEVAVYHQTDLKGSPETFVKNNTVSFFYVAWDSGSFPRPQDGCSGGACILDDGFCYCEVTVEDGPVFNTAPTNSSTILTTLTIGHESPDAFDSGKYSSQSASDYIFHSVDGTCCDIDTVFEVSDESGTTKFLRNLKSTVKIDGTSFSFRNPPQFNSVLSTEYSVSDAEYETDAVLQHLFYHPNAAPFLAQRFIQRFGISNPSPLYVQRVANAFKAGEYMYSEEGITLGSGIYGDLAAMISAILLDREHRSVVLDKDRFHGSLREPIIKVLAVFRALGFESMSPLLELDEMEKKIGEAPYEQPDVFSFFDPLYTPPGIASKGRVTAPEAQVMWMNRVVGIMNGLFALIEKGILDCDNNGFGLSLGRGRFCQFLQSAGGGLTFDSLENIADREELMMELSLLLTAGRLPESKQAAIIEEVNDETDDSVALRLCLQLLLTTPEFHATSLVDQNAGPPPQLPPPGPPKSDYKAVVHLALSGGADSFNILAPRNTPNCGSLRNEYDTVRGTIGTKDSIFDSQLLPLAGDATLMGQPCSDFGVHDGLPILQELYNAGDLSFLANTGVLTEPVTKSDWSFKTFTQLFAHNSMRNEVGELDPTNIDIGTGALGRMADALEAGDYQTGRTSISANPNSLAGSSFFGSPIVSLDEDGVDLFMRPNTNNPNETIAKLNGEGDSAEQTGLYGSVWSSLLLTSIEETDKLYDILRDPKFKPQTEFTNNKVKLISQLINARVERGVDRDFFFVELGGFDNHKDVLEQLEKRFETLNPAIEQFVAELKLIGAWDDVVLVQTSEFGRTLTGNSGSGTDHGWGGNYFVCGGNVKGGRIIGQYPEKLTSDGPSILNRGRVIPSLSWDEVFNGIADWMGVERTRLNNVLPNRFKFNNLLWKNDLFQ